MRENTTATSTVRATARTGCTGARPSGSVAASMSRPPPTATMPTGSHAASAIATGLRRPASSRPLMGRMMLNAAMPNTHSAMEKNIGAMPRP